MTSEKINLRANLTGGLDPDDPVGTGLDLALYFGQSADSFTAFLVQLLAKAGPGGFGRLLRVFPREAVTWTLWAALEDIPTASELAALTARIWTPETPIPSRHEISVLANNYNRGRAEASST